MAAAEGYTLRVNQLDALRVDEELLLLLQQEVGAALQHTFPAAATKYRRELQLLLQVFFFCAYTLRNQPTPGALLQNVRYLSSNSSSNGSRINSSSVSGGSSSTVSKDRKTRVDRVSSNSCSSIPGSTNTSSSDTSNSNTSSSNGSSTEHQTCSSTDTQTKRNANSSCNSSGARNDTDHVLGGRQQLLHQQHQEQNARNRLAQRRQEPLHAEVGHEDSNDEKCKPPATQQNLSLRQRLLLLLVSALLPYLFERLQEYIHKRYVALLAVFQQRMLRAQARRRMQQQQLLRQQQQRQLPQQDTCQLHQDSEQQHTIRQQQQQENSDTLGQQHQTQRHCGGCGSSESRMAGGCCSGRTQSGLGNVTDNSRLSHGNTESGPINSSALDDEACIAGRCSPATRTYNSGQTCCSLRAGSSPDAAAAATLCSASAILPVPTSTSAVSATTAAGATEAPALADPTFVLSTEEKRVLLLCKLSQIAELLVGVAQLVQTCCFLVTGRYRCLSDCLLMLRMQHIDPSLQRSVTLDLLQQQLAWQALLQLLLMVLPQMPQQRFLLRRLLRRVRKIRSDATVLLSQGRLCFINFLQQQVHQHTVLLQQRETPCTQPQQQQKRHDRKREGDSTGSRRRRTLLGQSYKQLQQWEETQEGEQHALLREELQSQYQQQQQARMTWRTHTHPTAIPEEQVPQHHHASTRGSRMSDREKETGPLILDGRQRLGELRSISGLEEFHQHARTDGGILRHLIGHWLQHGPVALRSAFIKHSCLLLLRVLHVPASPTSAVTADEHATPTAFVSGMQQGKRQQQQQQEQQETQQQERQEQKEEEEMEEEEQLGCVFCGRENIAFPFCGSNCSHRFCYYCVAAHPAYQRQVKRQQKAAATAAAAQRRLKERRAMADSSQAYDVNAGRANLKIAARPVETPPGAAAAASVVAGAEASELQQHVRAMVTGQREEGAGKRSWSSRERRKTSERNAGSNNRIEDSSTSDVDDSSSSSGDRDKNPKRGWLAFFGLTIDDEEEEQDCLKCPACDALVENIHWDL